MKGKVVKPNSKSTPSLGPLLFSFFHGQQLVAGFTSNLSA
jgi:hypothetical protein